jgi:hypothetical protein
MEINKNYFITILFFRQSNGHVKTKLISHQAANIRNIFSVKIIKFSYAKKSFEKKNLRKKLLCQMQIYQ